MFADASLTDQASSWKKLRTLCAVRVVIAGAAIFIEHANAFAASAAAITTAWGYLGLTLIGFALSFARRPKYVDQLAAGLAVDLLCISLLVLTSPGSADGSQMLFFAPVAGAALLSQLPVALLVAATASLVLLSDALLRQLGGLGEPAYAQVGALGAVMFGVAWVLNRLAARVLAQERLVQAKNAELEAQVQVNRAVINEMQLGILVVSQDGQVRAANPAARTVLELADDGTEADFGQRLTARYATLSRVLGAWARSRPSESRAWTVALEAPLPVEGEPPDLASRPGKRVRIRSIPFGVAKSTDAPLLVSIEDMREVEVQAMQLKLAAMGRLTASIAHEIRNPLAAIDHASALLAEENTDPAAQRLLRIVKDNVQRLDRIVEDVLSVSRATRVRAEQVPLAAAVAQIVADFARDRAIDPGRFALDIGEHLEVRFDRAHLTQIVVNLVANAARYSSEAAGAVEITSEAKPEGSIELTVGNDGPAITPDVRTQLFEPFFTTYRHGTGLGLFLARELAIANGADLFLDDAAIATRRYGCAFTLRFAAGAESGVTLDSDAS